MKKLLTSITQLTVLACLTGGQLSAQLNGTYSIDNTQLASASNFTSFTSFAAALNSGGVSGPVTVNVGATSGPYTEQVNFLQAAGISATNSITINGNGRTITFNATSTTLRHTVLLSGADYMTWNNMNFVGTNASNALVVHLWSGADNNTFNSCTFTAPLAGTNQYQVPFSISGTSVSATGTGNSGNNNAVLSCTTSGGDRSIVFYSSSAVVNLNNRVIGSYLTDFYSTGFYTYYNEQVVFKDNIIERLNRTNATTTEGIYLTSGTADALIDGNHIRKLFDNIVNSTSTTYGVYNSGDGASGKENIIRNNIISDIKTNGTIYGIYCTGAPYANLIHNTISLDDQAATAGTTRGIFLTGSSVNNTVLNNIITVTRAGTGVKYCLYYATAATVNLVSDYNVLYINAPAGTNNLGWLTNDYSTLASWQSGTGYDMNSFDVDPSYTSLATMNFVPTNTLINNMATPLGVQTDIANAQRNLMMPDPGALEFFNSPCNSAPGAPTFVTPGQELCAGTILELGITNANTFTNSGYGFQWYSSTVSLFGPFTSIPGATLTSFVTPPHVVNTYYNIVATCTLATGSTTSVAQSVSVAPTVTNSVPYFESFETLVYSGLPNCSWSASDPGGKTVTNTSLQSNNRVPRTGTNYATFETAGVTNYFYSNGIELKPGITYSASLWYITDAVGFNDWQSLTLAFGNSQTPAAMNTIASVSPVSPVLYTPLSNTFTVNSPGLYYLGISAVAGAGVSPFLTWDDLQVIIPCSLNSPSLVISASSTTICSGQPANLSALGADTYSWSTGATTSAISEFPVDDIVYSVTGTSTLTGCGTTLQQAITVQPSPQVLAAAIPSAICEGNSALLTAQGDGLYQYQWTGGSLQQQINVTPAVTTQYSVIAINGFGCTKTATTQVTVNGRPSVTASSSQEIICRGEYISLSAAGADTYVWTSDNSTFYSGNPVSVNPQSSSIFTVTGTDNNNCTNVQQLIIGVEDCTGLNEHQLSGEVQVYPNPSSGLYTIVTNEEGEKTYQVFDVSLRLLKTGVGSGKNISVDLTDLPAGVYSLTVEAQNRTSVVKLVKH